MTTSVLANRLQDIFSLQSPFLIDYQKPYGMGGTNFNLIPLKNTAARVQIYDGVAKIELQHDYANKSDQTLETSFEFPVSPDCAVTSLVIVTKDKEIEAKIVAREKAQLKYDDAIASGNVAYHLEYDKDSSELLTMKIGNMVPGQELSVRITFLVKLPVFDKSWAFVLSPTFTPTKPIGGQVKDPLDLVELAPRPGEHFVSYGEVQVDIIAHSSITRLVCLSHIPEVKYGEQNLTAHISLKKQDNRGFQLLFRTQDINTPKLFLQQSEEHKAEVAALVSFFPNFVETSQDQKLGIVDTATDKQYEQEDEEEELEGAGQFIFVLDRSGSMEGNNIVMARESARLFLLSLPSDSLFNIVSFGSSYYGMHAQSVKYTQETMQNALSALAHFQADMGGTQIYQPLNHIYSSFPKVQGYPRNIFLVTDGEVSQPESVVQLIGKHSSEARVHTFGIGSGASKYLVKQAAIAGKGSSQFISNWETNMNAKVISSLSQALKPGLVNIKTEWSDNGAVVFQGPHSIANTFHNEPLVLGAILADSSALQGLNLTISCTETKTRNHLKYQLAIKEGVKLPQGQQIFQLCAKSRIKELEDSNIADTLACEKLSLKYKVLSKATGMVAVEKLKSKAQGELTQIEIPVFIQKPNAQQSLPQFDLFGDPFAQASMPAFASAFSAAPSMAMKKSFQTSGGTVLSQNWGAIPPMGGPPPMNQFMMQPQQFGMGAAPPPPPPGAILCGNVSQGAQPPPLSSVNFFAAAPGAAARSPPGAAAPIPKPQSSQLLGMDDLFSFPPSSSSSKAAPSFDAAAPAPQFQQQALSQPQSSGFDLLSMEETAAPRSAAPAQNDILNLFDFNAAPQSSAPASSNFSPFTSISFDMNSLLSLQQFDGSWNMDASFRALVKQTGKNIEEPPLQFQKDLPSEMRKKVWATAVGVWILENHFSSRKGEWKRITLKSSKYLKGMGIDLKEVLELINSVAK